MKNPQASYAYTSVCLYKTSQYKLFIIPMVCPSTILRITSSLKFKRTTIVDYNCSMFLLWISSLLQALQALQRQPNAAQYFHQFMLQQQLNSAQLHSLAAVQQVRSQDMLAEKFSLKREKPRDWNF